MRLGSLGEQRLLHHQRWLVRRSAVCCAASVHNARGLRRGICPRRVSLCPLYLGGALMSDDCRRGCRLVAPGRQSISSLIVATLIACAPSREADSPPATVDKLLVNNGEAGAGVVNDGPASYSAATSDGAFSSSNRSVNQGQPSE